MRIPICAADLPLGFNKIAKYIGRHWPGGPLKLSQSRERLAHIMGYSSAYAVFRETVPEDAIKDVEWEIIFDQALSRVVELWKVDPTEFAKLMRRVPWHEIKAGRMGVNGNR